MDVLAGWLELGGAHGRGGRDEKELQSCAEQRGETIGQRLSRAVAAGHQCGH